MAVGDVVRWHDVECASYTADMPLWRRLAAEAVPNPVLDLGAGSGRVALELARAGHPVTAVELDADLAAVLSERASGLPIEVVCADAREVSLPGRFGLVICAMQTIQLMGGPEGRARVLERIAEHLLAGGRAGIAIVTRLQTFEGPLAVPDTLKNGAERYVSQPTAVRRDGDGWVLERLRTLARDGEPELQELDTIHIDKLSVRTLAREASAAGLRSLATEVLSPTDQHSGSTVVMLGG